MINIIK